MLQPYASPVERAWYYGMRGLVGLILAFLFLPILVIVPLSFNADSFLMYPMSGFSLRWYEEFATSPAWRQALMNSLIVSPLATLLAMVLGTLASIGLVLAHAILGVPFVVTTVTATLQGFDFNLVRAASSLGANPVTTFFRITLPMVAPGIISGGLFAFATSFDEVVVTLFLASPEQATLPRQMFAGIRENISPTIAAVATILIVLSTLMLMTLEWLRRRAERMRGARR